MLYTWIYTEVNVYNLFSCVYGLPSHLPFAYWFLWYSIGCSCQWALAQMEPILVKALWMVGSWVQDPPGAIYVSVAIFNLDLTVMLKIDVSILPFLCFYLLAKLWYYWCLVCLYSSFQLFYLWALTFWSTQLVKFR